MTSMHEVLGHGSGKMNPKLSAGIFDGWSVSNIAVSVSVRQFIAYKYPDTKRTFSAVLRLIYHGPGVLMGGRSAVAPCWGPGIYARWKNLSNMLGDYSTIARHAGCLNYGL